MTTEGHEIVPEFRLLLEACEHMLARKYDFRVTAGDWKQFTRDVDNARKFMEIEVDGLCGANLLNDPERPRCVLQKGHEGVCNWIIAVRSSEIKRPSDEKA